MYMYNVHAKLHTEFILGGGNFRMLHSLCICVARVLRCLSSLVGEHL